MNNSNKNFRSIFVTEEKHGFSGRTEVHWSDGTVDTYIPGKKRSNLTIGNQVLKPGIPFYTYICNPETGKHEGTWAVFDESGKRKKLTEEEQSIYMITGHGNYHTHRVKPDVPFLTFQNNAETGLMELSWAVSDESGNITFLTDEEKENYVKNYNDGNSKDAKSKDEQEER